MISSDFRLIFGMSPDFGGKPFSEVHYLCLRSMIEVNSPRSVTIYYAYPSPGIWWQRALELVSAKRIAPLRSYRGVPLVHPAHQSDVLRLLLLSELGGIYMDCDVLCVRPVHPLLDSDVVLGRQGAAGIEGLCNAVIFARPDAPFLTRWLDGFDPAASLWSGFRSKGEDKYWDEISVKYPAHLSTIYPDEVTIVSERAFYWPGWHRDDLRLLFEEPQFSVPDAYAHHLWEGESWAKYLTGDPSVYGMASLFGEQIRKYRRPEPDHLQSRSGR